MVSSLSAYAQAAGVLPSPGSMVGCRPLHTLAVQGTSSTSAADNHTSGVLLEFLKAKQELPTHSHNIPLRIDTRRHDTTSETPGS